MNALEYCKREVPGCRIHPLYILLKKQKIKHKIKIEISLWSKKKSKTIWVNGTTRYLQNQKGRLTQNGLLQKWRYHSYIINWKLNFYTFLALLYFLLVSFCFFCVLKIQTNNSVLEAAFNQRVSSVSGKLNGRMMLSRANKSRYFEDNKFSICASQK